MEMTRHWWHKSELKDMVYNITSCIGFDLLATNSVKGWWYYKLPNNGTRPLYFGPFKTKTEANKALLKEINELVPASKHKRTCNLHSDCDLADEMVRAAGGRPVPNNPVTGFASGSKTVMTALHCSTEDCEDCFGK